MTSPTPSALERLTALFISDTHGQHAGLQLGQADLLVHCGDLSSQGSFREVMAALTWLSEAGSFRARVVIAGNHDHFFEDEPHLARVSVPENLIYLEGQTREVLGLRLLGQPETPEFKNWAFNRTLEQLRRLWAPLGPGSCDVLITHGPARGVLDRTARGEHVGDPWLGEAVERARPLVHAHGHVHEGHGHRDRGVHCLNASVCTASYDPVNPGWLVTFGRAPGEPWQVLGVEARPLLARR